MKIVILGAGRIGGSLARNLSNSNYEVCVVDENKNRLSELEDRLDIMTVEGSASHLKTLKKSNLDEESIILAVTSNDEVNIVACQIAKKFFNVKKEKQETKQLSDPIDVPLEEIKIDKEAKVRALEEKLEKEKVTKQLKQKELTQKKVMKTYVQLV